MSVDDLERLRERELRKARGDAKDTVAARMEVSD
mgnify:CR=1 FL=1|jgi:hypothetical protein